MLLIVTPTTMGIPAYFAYVIKNHAEIVKRWNGEEKLVDNLYIDANSVIYDVVHKDAAEGIDVIHTEEGYLALIHKVVAKLQHYIDFVAPHKRILIAFDGQAPMAKLKQQRERRYKAVADGREGTLFITAGTIFMNVLNRFLYSHKWGVGGDVEVIVSGSDIVGEGEHKIFAYMRGNVKYHKQSRTFIYGLDADLIILSLTHVNICPNLFLFREDMDKQKGGGGQQPQRQYKLLVNIRLFAEHIEEKYRIPIKDYIFLSFLLGNDFMPHFPTINLRTFGIDRLIETYAKLTAANTSGEVNVLFWKEQDNGNGNVCWANVLKFVALLAENEDKWMREEHWHRDKMEIRMSKSPTDALCENPENRPIFCRETEKYIAPDYPNWRERYYRALFVCSHDENGKNVGVEVEVGSIVSNYLEGLEWCMKYYTGTSTIANWNWTYKHNYPPLLADIVSFSPDFLAAAAAAAAAAGTLTAAVTHKGDQSPDDWIFYVLPECAWKYVDSRIVQPPSPSHITTVAAAAIKLEWSYCRYLWESHILTGG
jgi:5'-3' exonuclease